MIFWTIYFKKITSISIYHFSKIKLVEIELTHFLNDLYTKDCENTLFVVHSSRNDIILGFSSFSNIFYKKNKRHWKSGLILCDDKYKDPNVNTNINNSLAPIISVSMNTSDVIYRIMKHTTKLNADDPIRTTSAIEHYSKFIKFDQILKN